MVGLSEAFKYCLLHRNDQPWGRRIPKHLEKEAESLELPEDILE
jgi:hypothetical protein